MIDISAIFFTFLCVEKLHSVEMKRDDSRDQNLHYGILPTSYNYQMGKGRWLTLSGIITTCVLLRLQEEAYWLGSNGLQRVLYRSLKNILQLKTQGVWKRNSENSCWSPRKLDIREEWTKANTNVSCIGHIWLEAWLYRQNLLAFHRNNDNDIGLSHGRECNLHTLA